MHGQNALAAASLRLETPDFLDFGENGGEGVFKIRVFFARERRADHDNLPPRPDFANLYSLLCVGDGEGVRAA